MIGRSIVQRILLIASLILCSSVSIILGADTSPFQAVEQSNLPAPKQLQPSVSERSLPTERNQAHRTASGLKNKNRILFDEIANKVNNK